MVLPLPPTWIDKGPLPQTQDWPILRYLNGKIYCVAFKDGAGYLGLEVYTIATDTWEFKTGPLPHDNQYAIGYRNQLAVANGKLYFVRTSSAWPIFASTPTTRPRDLFGSVQVYNTVTDTWTVLATFDIDLKPHWRPYQRSSDTSPVTILDSDSADVIIGVGNTIYSIGYQTIISGASHDETSREFWGYNVTTDTFTQLADRPANPGEPLQFPDVILGNNSTTVFTYMVNDSGANVAAYNIARNTWTQLPTPPGPAMTWPGFATDGGTLYLLGGRLYTDPTYSNTPETPIYQLNPGASAWTKIGDLPIGRFACGAIVVDEVLYLVSGVTPEDRWTDTTFAWGTPVTTVVLHYLRMTQRDDGLGVARSPRLAGAGSNGASSLQLGKPPRLGTSNTYL